MGKIFDALEKANKRTESSTSRLLSNTGLRGKKRSGQKEITNVVPFSTTKAPVDGKNIDKNLIAFHSPQSVEAEIFKVLRTNLLFPSEGDPPKSLLVTSAMPGDGKSFVSSNLAISIAHGVEEHVLLIDSDVRNPTINRLFGMGSVAGLSEYLMAGTDLAQNLNKTAVEKLTILPAGQPPNNPTELLTTQKMISLLSEVTNRYDDRYIIIDSAPPTLASETVAISNYVDGIIIVVRAGKTRQSAVNNIIEQLGRDKILGIVLNYADHSAQNYYGYGKAYYGEK